MEQVEFKEAPECPNCGWSAPDYALGDSNNIRWHCRNIQKCGHHWQTQIPIDYTSVTEVGETTDCPICGEEICTVDLDGDDTEAHCDSCGTLLAVTTEYTRHLEVNVLVVGRELE